MLLSAKPLDMRKPAILEEVWSAPEPRYWMSCKVQ
jgi:hypothetical protein